MNDWKRNPKDERNWSKTAIAKHVCRRSGVLVIKLCLSRFDKEELIGLPSVVR